jgi:phosphonate degradation associated HDIG domain protein
MPMEHCLSPEDVVEVIAEAFASDGAQEYLGEPVTQAAHMLQAAALAEQEGAGAALIAAALLHDVGHFAEIAHRGDLPPGTDKKHQETGASWLAQWFGPEVTEPVRLHVAAKRYLCATEPEYAGILSPGSVHSLNRQGGTMEPSELVGFEAEPHAPAAIRVRRWDDAAKEPDAPVPPFDHFRPLLRNLVRSPAPGEPGAG